MGRVFPSWPILAYTFAIFLLPCNSKKETYHLSCGNLQISCPFRLETDTRSCDVFPFILSCESNQTMLYLNSMKYYVLEIFYTDRTLRVVDSGLSASNCSKLPDYELAGGKPNITPFKWRTFYKEFVFVSCPFQVNESSYIPTSPCINSTSQRYLYVLAGFSTVSDLLDSCNVEKAIPAPLQAAEPQSYREIHDLLLMGLNISWEETCLSSACFFRKEFNFVRMHFYEWTWDLGFVMLARTSIGISFLLGYAIYTRIRRFSRHDAIEEFLTKYKNQTPSRYTYSEVQKMTSNFKEKLGQGGFGSVYKGNLQNGHPIAVKILGKCKGNGHEFINEVATIGRIHHINVVQLIGFCSDGSRRALIYDYMPNGSLDKFIFSQEREANPLSWEKIHEIALGIAHGIEYLHRGCDMKILHFDIKPHNILLNDKLIPKVSDFGLAKLYPADRSIVSVTVARGTMGYIAPELFYRSVGSISHKSDVYSFGMLLMEMAGRRRNFNEHEENPSQIFFPLWIYDQLDKGQDIEIRDMTEDEKEIVKRLITVALWCIQTKPVDRPSMSEVERMLEDSSTPLQWPPRPFTTLLGRESNETDSTPRQWPPTSFTTPLGRESNEVDSYTPPQWPPTPSISRLGSESGEVQ